ncbi:MAG: sigma 54-interacting transcriptional regulator [Pseudomonadota bacterium]
MPPSNPNRILLVDDDPSLLKLLSIRLRREGYTVVAAKTGPQALTAMEQQAMDLVLTDLKMDGMDGLQLLSEIKHRFPGVPVLLLTAHGTIPDAVLATKTGAYTFLGKPVDDGELLNAIEEALETRTPGPRTPQPDPALSSWRDDIITRNGAMETLLAQAALAAQTNASILIESESGTGKELLAKAVHRASPRHDEAFVSVNCTAIPESLLESEMFGHRKGAFTNAHTDRLGLFQQAEGGTLFFDEVGDMPLSFQAKLLRSLQERIVRPVGSDEEVPVDVRVISATHHDLEKAVENGHFREDLYYRLNVVSLKLPPLRERREDIPTLARHFLRKFEGDGMAEGFSPEALERLVSDRWPGNVRQLANVVQHCKVLCRSRLIPLSLVDHALRGKQQNLTPFAEARDGFEKAYLTRLLKATSGNVSQAARLAERNRSEFYKLLKKHGLEAASFRDRE